MRYLFALLILTACYEPTTPFQVEGPAPYSSPVLRSYWTDLEACSGLHGDFSKVGTYTATNIRFGEGFARGLWEPREGRIYILDTETQNPKLWKHEMMHALLGDVDGHPAQYFSGVCGDLIV